MKKKINFCVLLFTLCFIRVYAQNNKTNKNQSNIPLHLTKEQKLKDSIEFAKFKENHPEDFLNNRLPTELLDGGYVISGYSTSIQIENNHVKDSVYHNFHPGMPDTTTVNPFSDIKVTDKNIKVNLFSHLIMVGGKDRDSTEISPLDPDYWATVNIGKFPAGDFYFDSTAIKISINGKLLFDWKILKSFPKRIYKASERINNAGVRGSILGYYYGYDICDTTLNINDQLLIEIKNTKNNWMIDRYNITRVAVSADLSSVYSIDKKENIFGGNPNGILLKKNFTIEADDGKLLLFPNQHPFANISEIEYCLISSNSTDTAWTSSSGMSSLPIEVQPNNDYTLLLRYKFQQESVNKYTFHVKPHWWQTTIAKIFDALLFIAILFLLIFYFYRKTKRTQLIKQREKTEKSMLELKSIRSQLNPHFIFNSLSSIQGLVNTNKIESANLYLSEFSNLMRNTLTENDKLSHSLEKETELLESYLKMEQLRFQFNYTITTESNINIHEIEIPSLLLQPLIENAVKHGVSGLREKGKVNIRFYLNENNLIAEVKDNGKGFPGKNNSNGYGLKLTDERILLLNKIKGQHFERKMFRMNNETIVQIIFKNEN